MWDITIVIIVFIHSFRLFLQRLFKSTITQKRSRHITDTVPECHTIAPQATMSEGLAQGPHVAARVGFEPATHRTKGIESTNELPCPICIEDVFCWPMTNGLLTCRCHTGHSGTASCLCRQRDDRWGRSTDRTPPHTTHNCDSPTTNQNNKIQFKKHTSPSSYVH